MTLAWWIKELWGEVVARERGQRRHHRCGPGKNYRKPWIEPLEDRTLLAVLIGVSQGVNSPPYPQPASVLTPASVVSVSIPPGGGTPTAATVFTDSGNIGDDIRQLAAGPDGSIDFVGRYNGAYGAFQYNPTTGGVQLLYAQPARSAPF
jgi:hypothetical protein